MEKVNIESGAVTNGAANTTDNTPNKEAKGFFSLLKRTARDYYEAVKEAVANSAIGQRMQELFTRYLAYLQSLVGSDKAAKEGHRAALDLFGTYVVFALPATIAQAILLLATGYGAAALLSFVPLAGYILYDFGAVMDYGWDSHFVATLQHIDQFWNDQFAINLEASNA